MLKLVSLVLLSVVVNVCWSHGYLAEPPSRASAWLFGFNTPADYNHNQGFCGGANHQHANNGGKCGICGDAWDANPRPHEAGGKYATGTIVREYTQGQVIPVKVVITRSHMGHFEFRICPNNNVAVEATEACLDNNRLYLPDGSFKFSVPSFEGRRDLQLQLQLPRNLVCTQCVLQWRYITGNNWGDCGNGTGALGCGPQEQFRACADVAISAAGSNSNNGDTGNTETSSNAPTVEPTTSTQNQQQPSGSCHAVGVWQTVPGMNQWCQLVCLSGPASCPPSHCTCVPTRSNNGDTGNNETFSKTPTVTPTTPSLDTETSSKTPTVTPTTPSFDTETSSKTPTVTPTTPSLDTETSSKTPTVTPTTPSLAIPSPTQTQKPSGSCRAVGVWQTVPGMNQWCQLNCLSAFAYCPSSHCTCD